MLNRLAHKHTKQYFKEVNKLLKKWMYRLFLLLPMVLVCGLLIVPIGQASPQSSAAVGVAMRSGRQSAGLAGAYLDGIWISRSEISQLPMSGGAWETMKSAADESPTTPDLSNQDDRTDGRTLARALVYARTGEINYRDQVLDALRVVTFDNTEEGGRTLALGRNLVAYVVSADIIDLASIDASLNEQFKQKLRELLTKQLDGRTLVSTHEDRPNNWGTHAGASRVAVALYLDDTAELDEAARVFRGWLGDRGAYADFSYGNDLSWQCDPAQPVGINPVGCMKDGHLIDGAQPEEMRRGGSFAWPPVETGYAWEGLQGAVVTAELLRRAGYDAWEWEDRALLRAVEFLHRIDWQAEHDDQWQLWLLNYNYGTDFQASETTGPGKNMGWTAWTHAIPHEPTATLTPTATFTPAPTSTPLPPTTTATSTPTSTATSTPTTPTPTSVAGGTMSGTAARQGASDHSGSVVTAWDGVDEVGSTTADASGSYTLSLPAGVYTLTVEGPLALDAEKTGVAVTAGGTTSVSAVVLVAGDLDDSDAINIYDLSIFGSLYGKSAGDANWDARADLTQDGTVDIYDLSLIGGNYGKSSPVAWP